MKAFGKGGLVALSATWMSKDTGHVGFLRPRRNTRIRTVNHSEIISLTNPAQGRHRHQGSENELEEQKTDRANGDSKYKLGCK